ncbi:uncharacterized protein [Dermacentor albipictus]|uniref:uncharacterized protein isoform X5 n=1 Tax=Dermacentor albipictus TaxID=60249 RepID=UPI0038FBEB92
MCEQQRLRPGFHRFARFSLLEDQTMQPCGFSVPCQRIARTLNEHMENCEIIDALTTSRMIVASQKVAGSSASYRLLPRTRRRTNMLLQDEQDRQLYALALRECPISRRPCFSKSSVREQSIAEMH